MAASDRTAITRRAKQPTTVGSVMISCVFSVAALLFWAASEWSTGTVQQMTLSSLSLTVVAWGGAILISDRQTPHRSLLRLGPLMLASGGITFGLASVTGWLVPQTVLQLQLDTFRTAHALVIIGFIGFTGGYLFTPRVGLHRSLGKALARVDQWDDGRGEITQSAILTYSLGLGALILGALLSGSYGYLGDATVTSASDVSWYTHGLYILSSLRGFAIITLWVVTFQRTGPHRVLLAVAITVVDLTAGLLSGMKEAPTVTLIAVGLAYIYVKRRLPLLALVAVGSWFLLFLSPLVTSLRNVLRGNGRVLTLGEALPAMASGFSQASVGSGGDFWVAISRLRLIDNVAVIYQKTPSDFPFQPVWDLATLALSGFVPRAIWPTKPVQIEGLLFYQQYYGGTTYTAGAITIPGSFYMHGGVIVLVVGMVLFGMLTRSLDDGMRADVSATGLLLLLALLPPFVKMEMSAPTLLASLPSVGVGWLLASWLLYHPARDRSDKSAPQSPRRPRTMPAHVSPESQTDRASSA